jgi:hypothetical protein
MSSNASAANAEKQRRTRAEAARENGRKSPRLSLTSLIQPLRALLLLLLSLFPWTAQSDSAGFDRDETRYHETHQETGSWQPHESQCAMPREEFLAVTSGTFTVPEHLHYESHYTPSERLLIPNSCIKCPACEERDERQRQQAAERNAEKQPQRY